MGVMKISLLMQNVQGLNAPAAPYQIRNFLCTYLKNIDVLYLQEHKLRGAKLTDLKSKLWNQAHFFGCDATEGYGHQDGTPGAGRGGICLFVNPTIKHMIHSQGVVGVNHAQWIRLIGFDGEDIAILNVYALHSARGRIRLWRN
jgi:exonuclease III